MTPGDPAVRNSWGLQIDSMIPLIEQLAAGVGTIDLTGVAAHTLTVANNAPDEARMAMLIFTGTSSGTATITMPPIARIGWALNLSTNPIILTTGTGTTLSVPLGTSYLYLCDGTNVSGVTISQPGVATNETARATAAEAVAAGGIGRNRIHNGGFGINQRTQVSGVALAAGAYGHDRWKAGAGGCTYTFAQTQPSTVITITAGTLQQVIEALTVEGGSYTLSWIGTATARINAGSFLASPITVTGLAANTAITVEFGTGTVDRVQLEPGSLASVFVRRSFGYELEECRRFYRKVSGGFSLPSATAGNNPIALVPAGSPMRAVPTVVSYSSIFTTNIPATGVFAVVGGVSAPMITDARVVPANGVFSWYGTYSLSADL